MNNDSGLEIKKDTFIKMSEEGKSEVLFDYLDYMKKKLDKLEKRKLVDKAWSAAGGVVGGALAALGIKHF